MDIARILRHLALTRARVRRAFPDRALLAIERAIGDSEAGHRSELRFVVEGALDGVPLLRGQTARERAIELFARLHVWDTEHNTGVLIYLLFADRRVEIVADRGIHACAGAAAWEGICGAMEKRFRAGEFEMGAVEGIEAVGRLVCCHLPPRAGERNELSNTPTLM